MDKIGVGLIGAGSISELHLDACQNNPEVDLVAVCDLNEDRARAKAQKYGAKRVYTDYRELLQQPNIDAVIICTWNNTHAEISIAALEAGKHVFVEKPMSKTVAE